MQSHAKLPFCVCPFAFYPSKPHQLIVTTWKGRVFSMFCITAYGCVTLCCYASDIGIHFRFAPMHACESILNERQCVGASWTSDHLTRSVWHQKSEAAVLLLPSDSQDHVPHSAPTPLIRLLPSTSCSASVQHEWKVSQSVLVMDLRGWKKGGMGCRITYAATEKRI